MTVTLGIALCGCAHSFDSGESSESKSQELERKRDAPGPPTAAAARLCAAAGASCGSLRVGSNSVSCGICSGDAVCTAVPTEALPDARECQAPPSCPCFTASEIESLLGVDPSLACLETAGTTSSGASCANADCSGIDAWFGAVPSSGDSAEGCQVGELVSKYSNWCYAYVPAQDIDVLLDVSYAQARACADIVAAFVP